MFLTLTVHGFIRRLFLQIPTAIPGSMYLTRRTGTTQPPNRRSSQNLLLLPLENDSIFDLQPYASTVFAVLQNCDKNK